MANERKTRTHRVLNSPLAVDEPHTPSPKEKTQTRMEKTGTAAILVVLLLSIILLLLSRFGLRF